MYINIFYSWLLSYVIEEIIIPVLDKKSLNRQILLINKYYLIKYSYKFFLKKEEVLLK